MQSILRNNTNMYKLVSQPLREVLARTVVNRQNMSFVSQETVPVKKVIEGWHKKLHDAGVGDIEFNIKVIVAHVLKRKFNTLADIDMENFNKTQIKDFERFCEARCARMPLQHIIGEWDFLNITLKTAPTVFIPRPESEEFIRKVIEVYRNVDSINMLEVGCGSGALSLAMLKELPQLTSIGIERSKAATALSWENAGLLSLKDRFKVYNHTMDENNYVPKELAGIKFDLIISNPPYVRTDEFPFLQPEVVAYENYNALDGGPDGLKIAKLVFELACLCLRPAGKLWLELGQGHSPLVKTIMSLKYEGRLRFISSYKDQYKRERFIEIEKV